MSCNPEGYFPAVGDKNCHQPARKIQRVYLLELAFGAANTLYTAQDPRLSKLHRIDVAIDDTRVPRIVHMIGLQILGRTDVK